VAKEDIGNVFEKGMANVADGKAFSPWQLGNRLTVSDELFDAFEQIIDWGEDEEVTANANTNANKCLCQCMFTPNYP
jgi:hypothetical protein